MQRRRLLHHNQKLARWVLFVAAAAGVAALVAPTLSDPGGEAPAVRIASGRVVVDTQRLPAVDSERNTRGLWVATVSLPGGGTVTTASIHPQVVEVRLITTTRTGAGTSSRSIALTAASRPTSTSAAQTATYLGRVSERGLVRDHLSAINTPSGRAEAVSAEFTDALPASGLPGRSAITLSATDTAGEAGCGGRPFADTNYYSITWADGHQIGYSIICADGGQGGHQSFVERTHTSFVGKIDKPPCRSWPDQRLAPGAWLPYQWAGAAAQDAYRESGSALNLGPFARWQEGLTGLTTTDTCTRQAAGEAWLALACSRSWQAVDYRSDVHVSIYPGGSYFPRSMFGQLMVDF